MLTEISCARLASPFKVFPPAVPGRSSSDHVNIGDAPVLLAAQSQIRNEFRNNKSLDPNDASVSAGITHATEVATFLRQNLVQGKKVEGDEGMYSKSEYRLMRTRKTRWPATNRRLLELRIHEHTERGDNESIKMAGGGVSGGGCCSSR